jgi:hypothetical protein
VLPDVISEDTGTAVEYIQCVKSWEVSYRITVIVYKDKVEGPTDGGDRRVKIFKIQNKGLFLKRYDSRDTEWASFLLIEKQIASSINCKDAAFEARK